MPAPVVFGTGIFGTSIIGAGVSGTGRCLARFALPFYLLTVGDKLNTITHCNIAATNHTAADTAAPVGGEGMQ